MSKFSINRVCRLIYASFVEHKQSNLRSALGVIISTPLLFTLIFISREISGSERYVPLWSGELVSVLILTIMILSGANLFTAYRSKLKASNHHLIPATIGEKFVAQCVGLILCVPLFATAIIAVSLVAASAIAQLIFGYEVNSVSELFAGWSFANPHNYLLMLSTALFCSVTHKKPVLMTIIYGVAYTIIPMLFLVPLAEMGIADMEVGNYIVKNGTVHFQGLVQFASGLFVDIFYTLLCVVLIAASYYKFKTGEVR